MTNRNKIQVYKVWVLPFTLVIFGAFLVITMIFAYLGKSPTKTVENGFKKLISNEVIVTPTPAPIKSIGKDEIEFIDYSADRIFVEYGIPKGYIDASDPVRGYKLFTKEQGEKKFWIKIEVRSNLNRMTENDFVSKYLADTRANPIIYQDKYSFRNFVGNRLVYKNFDSSIGLSQFFVGLPRSYDNITLSREYHVITFAESIPVDISDESLVSLMKQESKNSEINQFFDNYVIEKSRNAL